MSNSNAAGNDLSSSSALTTVSEVEALIAALQASSIEWRDKRFSVAQHMHYARSLCQLQEIIMVMATNRGIQSLVDRGLVAQCIGMAAEHATLGMMSWVTVRTWEAIVTDLLRRTHHVTGSTSGFAHLVHPIYATVVKLAKGSLSTKSTDAALVANMRLLAVLLQYCPVELTVARRYLPHPIRAVSEAARTAGYALLPWLAINAKGATGDADGRTGASAGHVSSSSGASAYPILSEDLLEYLRKGLSESKEVAVREAATEAVRVMLEAGIRLTEEASLALLRMLVDLCEGGRQHGHSAELDTAVASLRMENDAAAAMGYLLALFQSGHVLSSVPQVLERRDVARWQYVGGPGPAQAARVQAILFRPNMSRSTQMALGTAVATLWWLCVTPPAMADAMRAFFVLLVPTPKDTRGYMPRILVNALSRWACLMPSNQYRAAIVYCLRDLLRRTGEARVILHTALLALQAVVCTLESTRQISRGLTEDMRELVAMQPSLSSSVAEVMASLATHSPHFRRTLLRQTVAAYKRYAIPTDRSAGTFHGGSEDEEEDADDEEDEEDEEGEEGEFTVSLLLLSKTTLSLPPALLVTAPLMKVLLTAVVCLATVAPSSELTDNDYRRIDYFFQFATTLLRYHRHSLSPFLMDKLESSSRMSLSLLVGHPATSPSYLRGSSAACSFLLVRGGVRMADTELCVGLLEGQMVNGAAQEAPLSPAAASLSHSLMGKLKGGVFDLVRETDWGAGRAAHVDLGSLRWTVTQALNTLQAISCDDATSLGVEVVMTDASLFPDVVVPLLGARRSHVPPSTGLLKTLSETGQQAIQLIAWAVRFFNDHDMTFCKDMVCRLANFTAASAASGVNVTPSLDDRSGGSGRAAQRTVQWNQMCVQMAVLEELHRLPAEDRRRWTDQPDIAAALDQWQAAALSAAHSTRVDLEERVLAAKVVAHLLSLLGRIDAFTVSALRLTGSPSAVAVGSSSSGGSAGTSSAPALPTVAGVSFGGTSGSAVAQSSGTLLILGFAHAAAEPPGTFSMAVSVFAESLRRTGLSGDTERPLILSTLLGVLSLIEMYASDVQATILDALLTALAVPVHAQLDPLVHSLVLAILMELDFSSEPMSSLFALVARTSIDGGAWHLSSVADVVDGRLELLFEAVSSETHQLQLPARSMVLQHLVVLALRETTLSVPFYFSEYRSGGGGAGAMTSSSAASNSARLLAVRRRQGHTFRLPWTLADSTTEWIAHLSAQCRLAMVAASDTRSLLGGGTDGRGPTTSSAPSLPTHTAHPAMCSPATLSLLEVSVLIDAAATEETRDVWANVALHMVLSATPAETTLYLQDISRVMQARLPDLGELLRVGRRRSLGPADAGDDDGAGDEDRDDALGVTYGSGELAARFEEGDQYDDEEGGGLRAPRRSTAHGNARHAQDEVAPEWTPICGDVASKVAYLALLVAVCDRHTPTAESDAPMASAAAPSELASVMSGASAPGSLPAWRAAGSQSVRAQSLPSPAADGARRAAQAKLHRQCLEVAVASVPLVESIPELLESAVALLQHLLRPTTEGDAMLYPLGSGSSRQSPVETPRAARPQLGLPSLLPWKIPLVAALKTVVQLSIFDSFPACQLVLRFLRCELADDTTTRRVTRGLLLLLMALEHLESESGREWISKDAGRVVLTLSAVLDYAMTHEWKQTAAVAAEGLGSAAGQAALAVLCRDLCCSVALANGYDVPADLKVPHTVAPEEGVDAGMLLTAAVQLVESPGVAMGPSLRHAVGCLASLVAATDGADLAPVARLVRELPHMQQRLIVDVALETLESSLVVPLQTATAAQPLAPTRADAQSDSPQSFNTLITDRVCLISEDEEQYLLDILVTSSVEKNAGARIEKLVEALVPADDVDRGTELPSALELRALLVLAFQNNAKTSAVVRILHYTHVDMIRVDASPYLLEAATDYIRCATEADIIELGQASAAGCALVERVCSLCRHRQHLQRLGGSTPTQQTGEDAASSDAFSPLNTAVIRLAVVERLREALSDTFDPRSLARFMWPQPVAAVRAVMVCLSLLCAEQRADLIVKAGPAMSYLFLELMKLTPEEAQSNDEAVKASLQTRMHMCLSLLATVVKSAPQSELLSVVLQPVGAALVQTVAKQYGPYVKTSIHALGVDRAHALRGFMEQSTLSTAATSSQ